MKYFRINYDDAVSKRSYINLILLNASIPSFKVKEDKKKTDSKTFKHPNEMFELIGR